MRSEPRPAPSRRLTIHRLAPTDAASSFADDVRRGLTANPKYLPPKYFYDELGSHLFEAICCLPEYYLTRAESELLSRHADEIIAATRRLRSVSIRLIELGSGSAIKTRYLISAALRSQESLHYLPIDISAETLVRSSEELLHEYPALRITGFVAEYFAALKGPARAVVTDSGDTRTRNVVLFLGSNIGNFEPGQARAFLREIRSVLQPGDSLLVGADLKKPESILLPAYDDALGVTAAFNRNLLMRINRELDGNFDLSSFDHRACYNSEQGRIESRLVSREPQTVRIGKIGIETSFAAGEAIHTENSYKFDLEQLGELARDSGFSLERTWFDSEKRFSFNLLTA